MKALIDGDILLYRIGYTTENEEEWIAVSRMENLIQSILSVTKATDHCVFFSDSRDNTFRAKLSPEYKANRTQPKPKHYGILKEFVTKEYNSQHEVEQEADDGMGIAQTEDSVICSIDKDLLQVPGHHYNFVKDSFTFITEEEGLLHFYKQLIIGDVADNVKGVTGIGPAKAAKLLDPLLEADEATIFEAVRGAYQDWLRKEWCNDQHDGWDKFKEKQLCNILLLNGRLLKIRTKPNEVWQLPIPFEENSNE